MKRISALFISILSLIIPKLTYAQIGLPRGKQAGGAPVTGNAGGDLGNLISNTITLFFTIGGIGFMIMILWGAVSWILSGGDKEKIAGARKRITTAIIGLIVLSSTFVIAIIVGQITGVDALKTGNFGFKGLLSP